MKCGCLGPVPTRDARRSSPHSSLLTIRSTTRCRACIPGISDNNDGGAGSYAGQRRVCARTYVIRTYCSFPTNDSSSRLVQDLSPNHVVIRLRSSINLSLGRRAYNSIESNSIPKNMMHVVGPTDFSGASGTRSRVLVALVDAKARLHGSETGGPTVK